MERLDPSVKHWDDRRRGTGITKKATWMTRKGDAGMTNRHSDIRSQYTHWDDITGARGIGMTREGDWMLSRQRSHKISIPHFKSKFLT